MAELQRTRCRQFGLLGVTHKALRLRYAYPEDTVDQRFASRCPRHDPSIFRTSFYLIIVSSIAERFTRMED
eukprot:XP_001709199.1 Hypothetical protein GL50803_2000 [Giardia lamblia ATCC 50803]